METQGNPDENNLWAVTYCSEMIVEQKYHNILPFSLGHCLSEKSVFFRLFMALTTYCQLKNAFREVQSFLEAEIKCLSLITVSWCA